jgi:hypothetical protein
MLDDLSLSTVLTLVRVGLLIAGVCAIAAWAARQPNPQSSLIARLTRPRSAQPASPGRCGPEIDAPPNQCKE